MIDNFFRYFLELKWKIRGTWVRFLDLLMFTAMTGAAAVIRLVLMDGFTGWYGLGDMALALLAGICVWRCKNSLTAGLTCYGVFLILPTLTVLSSYWQKPDGFYVLACFAGVAAVLMGKRTAGAILYGAGLLLNIQAVFLLPVFLLFWAAGRLSGAGIVVTAAAGAARLLLGTDVQQLLFGYGNEAAAPKVLKGIADAADMARALGQTDTLTEVGRRFLNGVDGAFTGWAADSSAVLTDNWCNVYQLLGPSDFTSEYFIAGLCLTGALVLGCIYAVIARGRAARFGNPEYVTELCMFFCMLVPYVAPHMNARSGLLADVFAVLLLFFCKRKFYFALGQLILSFSMYQICLTGVSRFPLGYYALGMLALLLLAGRDVFLRPWEEADAAQKGGISGE